MAPKWSSWACVSTSPTRFFRSFSRKRMSGMIRSIPGRCSSSPKETPRSTASQDALMAIAEAVDRQVHADLADAAERRKGQFVRPRHQASPHRCRRAEIDVAGRNRHEFAARGPDDHAALFVDGVEGALDRRAAGLDRDHLSEPGRALQPEPADFGKATAVVPDTAELGPAVRERREQAPPRSIWIAERRQRGRRRRRALRCGDDVGADADHDREATARTASASSRMPASFACRPARRWAISAKTSGHPIPPTAATASMLSCAAPPRAQAPRQSRASPRPPARRR